jgi:hypothetical protein
MTRRLIDSTIITYEITVSEDDLRQRLADQVIDDLGLRRETGLAPGTTIKVLRGDGRSGGYRVQITRDMSKDDTPRIEGKA